MFVVIFMSAKVSRNLYLKLFGLLLNNKYKSIYIQKKMISFFQFDFLSKFTLYELNNFTVEKY